MWLGGTQYSCLFRTCSGPLVAGVLDTLLGPEKTPCLVFFLVRLLALSPNASLVGVVVMVWSGVWLCVECCIVDASILLWSSV